MTDTVRQLVKDSGYPNMKVLEFAFDSRDTGSANDYLPHNYERNCVVYTGTHDNETLVSWYGTITEEERQMVRDYVYNDKVADKEMYKELVYLAESCVADMCIIPIQDWLGYDNSARMNQPSTLGNNWKWRLTNGEITDELLKEILTMTARYGRASEIWLKEQAEKKAAEEKAKKAAEKEAAETSEA